MKVITHEDIIHLNISPLQCYQWVEDALYQKSKRSDFILPPKISMKPMQGSFINVMPSVIADAAGTKIVTRFLNREPSLESYLLLLDSQTGEVLSFMSADFITTMRTGAVAAHSIKLLAKKNFNSIALIGLGNVTHATFQILTALYPDRELNVRLLRYKDQHEIFIRRFNECKNLTFEVFDSPNKLVSGADVVVSGATYLPTDICADKSFDRGVLLVPIHMQGFKNCDLFFDKVYGDDYDHIKGFKYFSQFKSFAEISDVLSGHAKGRESDEERILVYNIGISLHDVFFAKRIYDMLSGTTSLQTIDLKQPKNKLWV